MAFQHIRIKNTNVAGKVPTSGQIDVAELCVNLQDHKLYSKDVDGNIFELGGAGEIPSGGTDDRPTTPTPGDLYFDTTLNQLLYWDGSAWVPITGEPIDGEGYVKVSGDNMTGALTIGPDGGPAVITLATDGDITGGTYDQSSNTTAGYELTNTGILKVQRPASEGNNSVYKTIRVLAGTEENASISADGSAEFSGKLTIDSDSTTASQRLVQIISDEGSADSTKLSVFANGDVRIGDVNNETIELDASGEVKVSRFFNAETSTTGAYFCSSTDASNDGRAAFTSSSSVGRTFQVGFTGTTFIGGDIVGNDPNITLDASGSINLRNRIKLFPNDGTRTITIEGDADGAGAGATLRVLGGNSTNARGTISLVCVDTTQAANRGEAFRIGTVSNPTNAQITHDGEASFAGRITVGDFNASSSTSAGARIGLGSVQAQQAIETSGGNPTIVFRGLLQDQTTSQIFANGSASFAGSVATHGFNSTNGIATSPGVYINNDSAVSDQLNSALLVSNASGEETVDIKSDGSATFDGDVVSNARLKAYGGTNNNGGTDISAGSITVRQDGSGNDVFTIRRGSETPVVLRSDGSGEFEGKVTSASTVSGDAGTTLVTKDYVDANTGGTTGDLQAVCDVGSTTTTGATFGGKVYSGGNPDKGTETGAMLHNAGLLQACRSQGTQVVFQGYTEGNATPTSSILANGSANFADGVAANYISTSTTAGSFNYLSNKGEGADVNTAFADKNGTQSAKIYNNGSADFAGGNTQIASSGAVLINRIDASDRGVFVGKFQGTDTSTIFADGSASFSGAVDIGPFSAGTLGIRVTNSGTVYNLNNTANTYAYWIGDNLANDPVIALKFDGSADFAGDIVIGEHPTSGVRIYKNGVLSVRRPEKTAHGSLCSSSGANHYVLSGGTYDADSNQINTVEILKDGSASFAGGRALIDASTSKAQVKLENFDAATNGQGVNLDGGGSVRAQRPSSSGTADVFRGYQGNQKNVEILANGSASFSSTITAGGYSLANLQEL